MIEQTLFLLLSTDPSLSTLVDKRVYPNIAPQQGKLPLIVYQEIAPGRTYTHNGDCALSKALYQFSCWSESYMEAKQVAEALRTLLSGRQYMGGANPIPAIFQTEELDMYDPDVSLHRVILSFTIWYED